MKFPELLSAITFASAVFTAYAADATVVKDNAPGAFALANAPGTDPGDNGIFAEVVASSSSDGEGVEMTINLNGGGTKSGGPFLYHIHEKAVPTSGDCQAAGAHLDPTARGETPSCDATKPESCQVGDLSGKHGDCDALPGCSKSFRDKYLSLTPGNPAYIGDKSFVIHYQNKTRIACVNFSIGAKATNGTSSSSAPSSGTGTANGPSGSTPGSTGTGTGTGAPQGSSPSGTATGPASRSSGSAAPSATGAASSLQASGSFAAAVLAILGLTIW